MPKLKLTKTAINAIQLPEAGKRTNYLDTEVPGLALRVTSTGVKTYYLLRYSDGRRDWLKLGKYPDLTPEQARQAAQKALGVYASGVNPAEAKRTIKGIPALSEFFHEQYMPKHGAKKARAGKEDAARFEQWIAPRIGTRKLSEITRQDIAAIIQQAEKKGLATSSVKGLKSLCSVVFTLAIEQGFVDQNPVQAIRVSGRTVSRDRFLQPQELRPFFEAVSEEAPLTRDFILLALLTGARRSNVLAMAWEDVDLEQATWRIPKTKNGLPQVVTLVPEAVEILAKRKAVANGHFVFPSARGDGHLTDPKKALQRVLERAGLPYGRKVKNGITLHDLRRTLGSWQARTGANLVIIGKSLNHKTINSTMPYARLDQDPVREAVNTAVSAMLEAAGITEPAQVVPLRKP